jgi:tetratricopeptide (TPR) repeat protein
MTKGLASLVGPAQKWLTTEGFLDKVDESGRRLEPSGPARKPGCGMEAGTSPGVSGPLLARRRRRQDALRHYEEAVARSPDPPALEKLVMLLIAERRGEEAVARLREIGAKWPDLPFIPRLLANILRGLGRSGEALDALGAAVARDGASGEDWYMLSDLKRFDPPELEAMEALSRSVLASRDRAALLFALAKAHSDQGTPDKGFEILHDANRTMRRIVPYDEPRTLRVFASTRDAFTPAFLESKAGAGNSSPRPVFILGMPRSGTTLVEQILASHPAVSGTGESGRVAEVMAVVAPPAPDWIATLSPETLCTIGEGYLFEIAPLPGERVVDKTLENVFFAGILHLALPQARFIWVRRDPVDTCLSCYARRFPRGLEYANDLAELGRYHRAYEATMRHWQNVFPPGTILDVRYEDVVSNLSTEARRLVAHCGLGWDEACLSFHRTERPVFTASASQVRRPIYRTAIGRWRPPQTVLRPLLDALGPYAAG